MLIIDGREKMMSEHRALRSLARIALDCTAMERRRKDEAEVVLADTSESSIQVTALRLELSMISNVRDCLGRSLDNYTREIE